jgi:hypothetical protein
VPVCPGVGTRESGAERAAVPRPAEVGQDRPYGSRDPCTAGVCSGPAGSEYRKSERAVGVGSEAV